MSASLEGRLNALEARVAALEEKRPGRKGRPLLVIEMGVCGLDPDRESDDCPDANIYRRQQGCLGHACARKAAEYQAEYYRRRRDAAI